jgi:hypothetical protein
LLVKGDYNTFNVYLDDLTSPVATDVSTQSFTFNEQNHLLIDGEHTYKAGVKAVFTTGESLVITKSFVYNRSVSVADESFDNLKLYPNPASDAIIIEGADKVTIQLFNATGRMLKIIDTYSDVTSINVSDLANGIYILKIDNGNSVVTRNLIINK